MPLDIDTSKLRDRFRHYEGYYASHYANMRKAKAHYDLNFSITKPPKTEKFIPPTGRTRTDIAVDQLITDSPKVHRHRDAHDEHGKKADDAIELALQGFLLEAEEYLQSPPLYEASQFQMQRGAAVLGGPFYDVDEGRTWFDVYDPLTVLMEPGASPREGFLHITLTVAEMEQLAQQYDRFSRFVRGTRTPTHEIKLVQWWSWDSATHQTDKGQRKSGQYAAWINEDTGFLHELADSGYPYMPLDVVGTGWGVRALGVKPEENFIPLLHQGARDMLVAEAEMFTMLHAYASQVVWNRYKAGPGTTLPANFQIDPLPNSITFDWATDLVPLDIVPMPREVAEGLGRINAYLDDTLFSRILAGQRQPGVTTATAYAMLTGGSRKKFRSPMRFLQGGTARLLLRLGYLVDYLTVNAKVAPVFKWRGAKLDRAMYGDDFTVEVDLMAEDDEERRLKIAEGQSLKEILSERELYEDYAGRENFTGSRRERMLDNVMNSDWFNQLLGQVTQMAVQGRLEARQQESQARQTPVDETQVMDRFAQMFRAAKTGNAPGGLGPVEGAAQGAGQAPPERGGV